MTTIIKLKRKSVPGDNPSPSDLEHGELAINYADGKIYYKNSSNAIAQFLDSGQIVSMIDSAYIDDRINSLYLDSAEAIALVDSAYVNARLDTSLFLDSAEAIQLVDSAYVNARLDTSLFLDSAEAIALVDSDYVQARIDKPTIDALNVDADTLDSLNSTQFLRADSATTFTGGILTLNSATPEIHFNGTSDAGIDMAIKATPEGLDFYEPEQADRIHFQIIDDQGVNAPFGMKVGTAVVFHESNYESYIDSAYVNARLDDTLFMDSAEVINLVDSAYVNARLNTLSFLDSAEAIALIDSNLHITYDSDASQVNVAKPIETHGIRAYDAAAGRDWVARFSRLRNEGNSPANVLISGDADARNDIALEVRGLVDGTAVNDSAFFDDSGTTFAVYQSGHTLIGYSNLPQATYNMLGGDNNVRLQVKHGITVDSNLVVHTGNYDTYFDSNLGEISQHIIPAANEVYDLGDSLSRFRDLYLSGTSINLGNIVMSEHTGRIRFTNHTTGLEVKVAASNVNNNLIDSTRIFDLIDSVYIDQINTDLRYLDSDEINTRIDAFIDSAVFALIDSSFYIDSALAKQLFSVTGGVLTYNSGTGVFGTDSANLYQKSYFDSDFATKTTADLTEGSNLYYTQVRADSAIDARVTQNFIEQLGITSSDADLLGGKDSDYYLNYDNFTSTPFVLDSSMVKNIFSTADSNVLHYNSGTGLFTFRQNNLYSSTKFDSDFDSAFGEKTTSDVPEGTNLYYTTGRHDSDLIVGFAARSTNNLSEGSSNKYYTVNRVDSDIDARVTKTYVDNLGINATQLNGQAGGHYLDYTNFTNTPNVLDSTDVKNVFSVSGSVLQYNANTGTFSTVTNALYRTVDFDSDLGTSNTDNLSEGSTNLYFTTARADSDAKRAISVTDAGGDGSLSYNNTNGVITYTGPSATETRAHFTGGNGISISAGEITTDSSANVEFNRVTINGRAINGGNYGAVNINKNNTLGDSTASVFGYTSDDSSRNAVFNLAIDNQYNANIGLTLNNEFIFGTQNADVTYKFVKSTGVNPIDFTSPNTLFEIQPSGNSKFYSGTDATTKTSASLVLVGGLGVDKTIRSNDIVVVNNVQAGTNGTGKFIGNVDGTVNDISNHTTTDLTEGINLYYTTARFDSDLGTKSTSDVVEGTRQYYTTARADSAAKNAISVNDAGGDGSFTYDNTTGVLTYTGPSATEVRSHFSAGTGVTINSGTIAIGQAVSTTDSVEFGGGLFTGDVVIQGDLTITGTQTATAQADLSVSNAYIVVADSNLADNVDIGIVGQYSDDGGITKRHTGFVRDASNGEWYVFDNLVQSNIDSSPRAQTINLTDSTVNLPTWNFGALRGQYLGFDSDFTQYSTNYQVRESDFTAVTANRYAVDTTDGQVVCTLPASPSTGDYVKLIDISNWSGTNTVILSRNGSTIEGYTDNFELDLGQSIIELIYINNTWNIYSSIGQRGPQGEKGDSADVASFATTAQAISFAIALG